MMNRFETNFPGAREAKLRYEDAEFSIITQGDFVRCAVTGKPIRLDELKYWSVARQEPYASAEIAFNRHLEIEC
jgi:hypothetical protein